MSISWDLLNTVLKVKNRMVTRVLVVYPCDHMAGWLTGNCSLLPEHHENDTVQHIASPGEDQNSKYEVWFSTEHVSLLHHSKVKNFKLGTVYTQTSLSESKVKGNSRKLNIILQEKHKLLRFKFSGCLSQFRKLV